VVEAVGSDVRRVAAGDRVYCGRTWGAHREFIDTDAAQVVPLPDELGWVEAACAYWAVPPLLGLLAAEPQYGGDAAVVGLGPLGLMGVQHLARFSRQVLALDTVEERRALAVRLGATDAVDPRELGELPDKPAVVLEVSGTQPGLETALAIVRPQGRVALVGSQQRLSSFDLFWPLQNSGARIVPLYREGTASVQSAAGNPAQRWLPLIHDFLGRGWLRIEPLITWVVSPEVAPTAFELLHRRPELAVGMAIAWDPALARDDATVGTLARW